MINIISAIATAGVAIGSLALVIVLSAFNGLETLVAELYTSVDPDIRISPATGKTFDPAAIPLREIADWPEVLEVGKVLEETVFVQFRDQQTVATLRGVEENYIDQMELDGYIIEGSHGVSHHGYPGAMVGYGIADNLNLFISDGFEGLKVFAADRKGIKSMNPEQKFVTKRIVPIGIVSLNPEFDFKYLIVPFAFATDLLQYQNRVSFIEIALRDGENPMDAKLRIEALLGEAYSVKTRIELNDVIYKTNATEKWITFFILSFILVVATFNLVGSLTMLIIDKRGDIALLRAIGQSVGDIQGIFLKEGILITGLGAAIGMGTGIALILAQQYIGFFPLEGGLVEYYPVEMRWVDVILIAAIVFVIGALASLIPVKVLLTPKRLQTVVAS